MEKNNVNTENTPFRKAQPPMPKESETKLKRKEDGPPPEFGRAVETDDGTIEDVPEEAAP